MKALLAAALLVCVTATLASVPIPDEDNVLSPRFMELQFSEPAEALAQQKPSQKDPAPVSPGSIDKKAKHKADAKEHKKPKSTPHAVKVVAAKQKVAAAISRVSRLKKALKRLHKRLRRARRRLHRVHKRIAANEAKIGAATSLHLQAVKARDLAYKNLRNLTVVYAEAKEKRDDARTAKEEVSNQYLRLLFQQKYHQSKRDSYKKQKDSEGANSENKKLDSVSSLLEKAKKALVKAKSALKTAREKARTAGKKVAAARAVAQVHARIARTTGRAIRKAKGAILALKVSKKHIETRIAKLEAAIKKKRAELVAALVQFKKSRAQLRRVKHHNKPKPLAVPEVQSEKEAEFVDDSLTLDRKAKNVGQTPLARAVESKTTIAVKQKPLTIPASKLAAGVAQVAPAPAATEEFGLDLVA